MKLSSIVFVCIGNSCRSQMAEGFAKKFGKGLVEVDSAGTNHAGWIVDGTYEVMGEKGIDMKGHQSKGVDFEKFKGFDYIINIGGDPRSAVPSGFSGVYREWKVKDPYGHSIEYYRKIRDEIEGLVQDLIEEVAGNKK